MWISDNLQKIKKNIDNLLTIEKCKTNKIGTKYWVKYKIFTKVKLHRQGGPAVEYTDGTQFWYQRGKLHREDGPAVEYTNGKKYWYLYGKKLTESQCKKEIFRSKIELI